MNFKTGLASKRITGVIIALAMLALLTWLAFRPAPIPVETMRVDTGPLEVLITEEGRTHVHERYVLSSPITAYRPRLDWHIGDPVRSGQLIVALQPSRSAALDPRSRAEAEAAAARAGSALQAARTGAEAARARVEFAEKEYGRLKDLFEAGTISRQQLDAAEYEQRDARAHLRSAEFAIDVAQHELEVAQTRLSFTADNKVGTDRVEIRAPTDGVVLAVPMESEAAIQPGEPIIEIGNPATLEVHVELLTTEAVRVRSGMPVRLVRWGGGEALDGVVRLVEPVGFTKVSALGVEEQRARVIVDITSPQEEWLSLGDGYRIEAEFITWRGDEVTRAPDSALFRNNDRWMVFVIEDGVAYQRAVQIGHRGEQHVEITDGLQEGDKVVLYPGSGLHDAARVETFAER